MDGARIDAGFLEEIRGTQREVGNCRRIGDDLRVKLGGG
jgi:hypothetical protein